MSNAISAETVLRIMEVRDKRSREELLSDIRLVMGEIFRNSESTSSRATAMLTEDKILEILTPLLWQKSMSGEYSSNLVLSINH